VYAVLIVKSESVEKKDFRRPTTQCGCLQKTETASSDEKSATTTSAMLNDQ